MNENNLLREISCKIRELEALHIRREDMCVSMSNIVFNVSFIPQAEQYYHVSNGNVNKYEGVDVNVFHPYNEIVIYDKNRCGYDDRFVKKISIDVKNQRLS